MKKLLLAVALTVASGSAAAQAWPAKPIKFIVPVPPGTSPDLIGRRLVERGAGARGPAPGELHK
jgi:tripartite-type tricarboxylate transporter receptor subunit TctC